MNHVEFRVRSACTSMQEAGGGPAEAEVVILVDGADLLDAVREVERPFARAEGHPDLAGGYAGMPAAVVAPPARLLLGEDEWALDGRVSLFRCACGSEGCWPLMARIEVNGETVTWRDFQQPHRGPSSAAGHWRHDALGPFVFARAQYEEALARLACDAAAWGPPA